MKTVAIFVGIGLCLSLGYTYWRMSSLGYFANISIKSSFSCDSLTSFPGPEDMVLDSQLNLLYVMSLDRRNELEETVSGQLYTWDLLDSSAFPEPTALPISFPFHPHGISAYFHPPHKMTLFVINHRHPDVHTIEVFQRDSLLNFRHLHTLSDPQLSAPNDLIALDTARFYVTNDSYIRRTWMRSLDVFLQLGWGSVLYYNGNHMVEVANGLAFPNGIALSPLQDTLYVTETVGGYLRLYDTQVSNDQLVELKRFAVGTGLDNIQWDRRGRLLVAAQPNLPSLAQHRKRGTASPSQVYRLTLGRNQVSVDTLMSDDGAAISAASSVAAWRDEFFIGVGYDSLLCRCKLVE